MSSLKYQVPSPPIPTKFPLKSPRGANLATRVWPVKNNKSAKALCLLVHGAGGHSGYFDSLATHLTENDIFCASYDQVNCGYSDPEPDTPSPGVTHVRNFDCFMEDVCAAIEWMQMEAGTTTAPVFLFGESFGALQVIGAAFEKDFYNCKIDGVISSGGMLKVGAQFLPPMPIVYVLVWLAQYYPKIIMPATNFESTFDDAFGDKDWAKTFRADPKVAMEIKVTIGAVAATLATGSKLLVKAKEFPVPFYAIHGKGDVRTSCEAMEEFVDNIGPSMASMDIIDTTGHQLLQDKTEIVQDVLNKITNWILKRVKEN